MFNQLDTKQVELLLAGLRCMSPDKEDQEAYDDLCEGLEQELKTRE